MRRCLAAALTIALAACGDDGPAADTRSVAIRAWGCALTDEVATGVVVGHDLVLTVGHVLRRAERLQAGSIYASTGAILCLLRYRTNRLWTCVVAHMIYNAPAAVMVMQQ